MEFRVREAPAVSILSVKGEIDLATAPLLHRELERVAQGGRDIVVDLSQVEFLDLRGIRVLETFNNILHKERRRLVLCASPYMVHRILHLAEVHKVIPMHPSIEAALEALNPGDG